MIFKSILTVTVLFVMQANGLTRMPRQTDYKCDLTAKPQCSSDCTKILACVSRIENPILMVNCTGNTPYCDNGRCVAAPGKCTKRAEEAAFLCTSSGVFPDPKDCRKSHFCAEVGSQSVISVCPRGHIFDSKTKVCGPKTSDPESICQKISCEGVTNDFVTFAANPTFYAYCFTSATGVQHTYMYKCDDEFNKVFDVTIKKCRFNCTSIGYYADPTDCTSYYICNGLQFASRRVHCPPNYYFNGTVCLNSKAHCPLGSIITSSTAKPTSTDISMADDMFTTLQTTSLSDSSSPDALTSTQTPIADTSLADEISSSYEPTPTVEITTETTVMPFSVSSTTETSTTHKPVTVESFTQTYSTTKKPSIWKHMGLISVRVGRLLNIF